MRQYKDAFIGDTVKVKFKMIEEGSERLQAFEGTLIKVRGGVAACSIAVRRISFGVGVERIFPTASPRFVGLDVMRRGKVRRSKLYYLRGLSGKAHRVDFQEETRKKPVSAVQTDKSVAEQPAPAATSQAPVSAA